MALVSKTALVASVVPARLPGGVRHAPAYDRGGPVDETAPLIGARFDHALTHGQEREYDRDSFAGEDHTQPSNNPGVIDVPSEIFITLFENNLVGKGASGHQPAGVRGFAIALMARAVNIYETNAKVISGEYITRGTSLNFTL